MITDDKGKRIGKNALLSALFLYKLELLRDSLL